MKVHIFIFLIFISLSISAQSSFQKVARNDSLHFTLRLPGELQYNNSVEELEIGETEIHQFIITPQSNDPNDYYQLLQYSLPIEEDMEEELLADFVSNTQVNADTLLYEYYGETQGAKHVIFKASISSRHVKYKVIIRDGNIYALSVGCLAEDSTNKKINEFFEGFRLLDL